MANKQLIERREVLRIQLKTQVEEIKEMLKEATPDKDVLEVSRQLLENTKDDIDDLDVKLKDLMMGEDITRDAMVKEYQDIEKFKRIYLTTKNALIKVLGSSIHVTTSDTVSVRGDEKKRRYHLPEVKLKSFGGDLKDWLGWWSQFEKIHLDDDVHDTDKFQYLNQSMQAGSEAKAIVESYPQTEGNYAKAIEALRERYGRQDLQLQVYVRELLSLVISNVTSQDKLPLEQLSTRLESHLRCLKELQMDKADPETWLYPLVESSLSEETLRAWQRSDLCKADGAKLMPKKTRLELLMEFIKLEVQCEQQIALAQQGFETTVPKAPEAIRTRKSKPRFGKRPSNIATAAGLLNQQAPTCAFCGKPHDEIHCYTIKNMSLKEREKLAFDKQLCLNCLKPGHIRIRCTSDITCKNCSRRHHTVLCRSGNAQKASERQSSDEPISKRPRRDLDQRLGNPGRSVTFSHQNSNQCSKIILLNTLKVKINDKYGKLHEVRLVGDSGSQRSYATTNTIERSGSPWIGDEWLQNVLFGGELTMPEKTELHEVTILGDNGSTITMQLLKKDIVTGNLQQVPQGSWINELEEKGIHINDVGDNCTRADILIGNDYWGSIRTGRMIKLSCGLIAEETIFGWTLGGRLPVGGSKAITNVMSVCSQDIEKLWSLETIGIRDPIEKKSSQDEEVQALEHFKSTVQRDRDGRYIVSLPWKSSQKELPSNFKQAEHRLKGTTHKLVQNRKLNLYHQVFKGWEQEELIVKVSRDDGTGHYIPHRPVFKKSSTTPVRPVFDASCRSNRFPSLNDLLYKGPNLIELIPAMLLRFGEKSVGVTADIRKAFQMLKVKEEDQQYQRFLWWKDESCSELVIYQHQRVVFGITSSPFLLGAVIHHHLDSLGDKELAKKLKTSFYVDNLVTFLHSHAEYLQFKSNCVKIMQEAQMELRQWASTSDVDTKKEEDHLMPILGIIWNRDSDSLSCVIKEFSFGHITKRNILSVAAQIFDPVGYLSPVMILPKLLVQEAWAKKLGWDQQVPSEAAIKFTKWTSELYHLKNVKVARYKQIANPTSREVHIFCDSSSSVMAAVGFLRTDSKENVAVQFLMAKSRLAPLNKLTIPRSELVSCVLGVRIAKCIREALHLPKEMFFFWSDSSTALAWIARNGDWGVFVRNRVKEILEETTPSQWRHVPGNKNPADLPSRGCSAKVYVQSKWWEGPDWLRGNKNSFPNSMPLVKEEEVNRETLKTACMMNNSQEVTTPRFSSYRKNVAVWGWVLRFIKACRKQTIFKDPYLRISEIREGERIVLKNIQCESFGQNSKEVGGVKVFLDEHGIMRIRTRLTNRTDTDDFIFPILLPKTHPLVDLLVMEMHLLNCHGGVHFLLSKLREKYWILHSRRTVRRVLRMCIQCKRHTAKTMEVEPAALPSRRVEDASVFATTGVDLAGPLFLRDGTKAWVVLYTCAVYRAIYLDVVTTLSTGTFLLSLERFISTYGRPNTIYSDNGTNFVGAANLFKRVDWEEVQQQSGARRINWIFNPPTAAWYGGWWERLVRSVKELLKRMLGRSKLNYEELRTCLAGVAATINDRPLTVITEDSDDLVALTPAMFMRPPVLGHFPELSEAEQLKKNYIRMKRMQRSLQHRFRKEYLCGLVTRTGKKQQDALSVGDVVLVGTDNRKRFEWPLGILTELIPGDGGKVRVVKVKTANGILTRPLQRLYPLEISSSDRLKPPEDISDKTQSGRDVEEVPRQITRRGRISKPPVRYGQWLHLVN